MTACGSIIEMMKKNYAGELQIKFHKGSYDLDGLTDYSCIINEITHVDKEGKSIELSRVKLDGTLFKVHDQTTIDILDLCIQSEVDKMKGALEITLEDTTGEDEEEHAESEDDAEIDAHLAYVASGCESFDEFMDRYNEGEL